MENFNIKRQTIPRKSKKVVFQLIKKNTTLIPLLTTKITGNNNHGSLISVNVNELNSPIKRYRPTD